MLIIKKVSGGSFAVTLLIALLIGLMSMLLVLQAYYAKNTQLRIFIEEKLDNNLNSGIAISLSDTSFSSTEESRYFDLYNKNQDSISIKKFYWGTYQVSVCKAWSSGKEKSKEWMAGSCLPSFLKCCIYLIDHDMPLSIVGNTKLLGDACLPKAGIRIAYIDQQGYQGDTLVYGNISQSQSVPPALKSGLLEYLDNLLVSSGHITDSELKMNGMPDTLVRKFGESLVYYHETGIITLSNIYWNGHIIVRSDSLIEIENSANLQNIICVAPEVRIKTGFKGKIQVLASDKIWVEDSCDFQYPSALILSKKEKSVEAYQSVVHMGKHSEMEGGIYTFCGKDDIYKTSVEIMDSCRIIGLVFVNGYLSLKTDIAGTVLTDFLVFRNSSSIFENHLVGRKIDRTALSSNFTGPTIFQERSKNRVIQWLN